jgi:hypothetical protein
LCQLFTTTLCHCEVTGPKVFWESICEALSEDIQYKRRRMYSFQTLQLTDVQIKAYALLEIEKLIRQIGRSMTDFTEIEMPSLHVLQEIGNRLMKEDLNYDREKQKDEHDTIYHNLNENQKIELDIMEYVDNNQGKQIFVEGHGGTWKTYLWNAIATKIRSHGKIVLAVASCGIAALLLDRG